MSFECKVREPVIPTMATTLIPGLPANPYQLYSYQDICGLGSSEVTTTVVLGLIQQIHVREGVLDDTGKAIDPARLRPISRLGGVTYGRTREVFELPRSSWRNLAQTYEDLILQVSLSGFIRK